MCCRGNKLDIFQENRGDSAHSRRDCHVDAGMGVYEDANPKI